MTITSQGDLDVVRDKGLQLLYPPVFRIGIGCATCGIIAGAEETAEAIRKWCSDHKTDFMVVSCGCAGFCQEEPMVMVTRPGGPTIVYGKVTTQSALKIMEEAAAGRPAPDLAMGKIVDEDFIIGGWKRKVAYQDLTPEEQEIPDLREHPFYRKQVKVVLRNCGFINPDCIEEYVARGGYYTALKVITGGEDPETIIKIVTDSGLRGRGGGGFPTGRKWASCRKARGEPKYVICNADEGDPGAYMDRGLLEGDPHAIIEGMIIGAYAIGAAEGYIYVRNEYPLALKRLRRALEDARRLGFLGEGIFGTSMNFDIKVVRGGGAFVCGESTALMASIEGKVGEPRAKFVHTAESGVWNRPSNLNNVETWANVPPIVNRGADWFRSMGTPGSTGTKVFSLVGKVKRTGLVEVPMGISLREMIYEVGGGPPAGRRFKAVQTGGPSGGAIPVAENSGEGTGAGVETKGGSLIDLPVDFDELTKVGSMMGSGGMIVMDEDTCMVDVACYFTDFLVDESCGKCSTCREGLKQISWILNDICKGLGREEQIATLERLSRMVMNASLCALGGTAANPTMSTLRYFRDEYEEHIRDRVCRSLFCKSLIRFEIDASRCTACAICRKECPSEAISGGKKEVYVIDQERCIRCGVCFDVCKYGSVLVRSGSYWRRSEHTKTNLKPLLRRAEGKP